MSLNFECRHISSVTTFAMSRHLQYHVICNVPTNLIWERCALQVVWHDMRFVHGLPRRPWVQGSVERVNWELCKGIFAWICDHQSLGWVKATQLLQVVTFAMSQHCQFIKCITYMAAAGAIQQQCQQVPGQVAFPGHVWHSCRTRYVHWLGHGHRSKGIGEHSMLAWVACPFFDDSVTR